MIAKRLPVWAYLVVVLGYLVVVQGLGAFFTKDLGLGYANANTIDALWRSIALPIGIGLVLVAVLVTVLRWWRPVLADDRPVSRWVLAVPVVMFGATLVATDYGGLAERGLGFSLLLLLGVLFVGFAEETLFRGVGLVCFRQNGYPEGKVALWTSVIFGLAHASNLISNGPKAFVQVLVTAIAGYFFYLVRRRTGGLLAPAIVHALWDLSLMSATVVPGRTYAGPAWCVLALIVLAVVVVAWRRQIEPAATVAGPP
ncbi:CPBP family intramembrane metalloprotease [Amycolatopsis sp. K13G38]|uniref:CPBP family intramembrane metalloprotease n=1 Tax=Amycolatopsis acididurans TaxID=2724524 RepID=A0ABX1J050_9PSEU|nr:CPBP family intramembrane glutamic endopeptidase [Amycolatopsis acididurans]NKQ53148.1 CPBP family intramembrane metalloprotease [Amycolatopsis acididurans]